MFVHRLVWGYLKTILGNECCYDRYKHMFTCRLHCTCLFYMHTLFRFQLVTRNHRNIIDVLKEGLPWCCHQYYEMTDPNSIYDGIHWFIIMQTMLQGSDHSTFKGDWSPCLPCFIISSVTKSSNSQASVFFHKSTLNLKVK